MERSYQALKAGRVWWEQGSFERALHAWKNALRCTYEEQNFPVMYVVCKNLGMICMQETQQLEEALEYFHYAKEIVAQCELEDILHRYPALYDSLERIEKQIIQLEAIKQVDKSAQNPPSHQTTTSESICCATCDISSMNTALVLDKNDGEMYCQKCYDEYYAHEDYQGYEEEEEVMDDHEDEWVDEEVDITHKEEDEEVETEELDDEQEEDDEDDDDEEEVDDLPFKLIIDLPRSDERPIESTKTVVKNYSLSYLLSFQDQCTDCPEELKSSLVHRSNAKKMKSQQTRKSPTTITGVPAQKDSVMTTSSENNLMDFFPSQEQVKKMQVEFPMEEKMPMLLFSSPLSIHSTGM